MSYIKLFNYGRGYYRGNIRISWKHPRSMDIIHILCICPYIVEIIRISWKYPRSVDIIYISSIISLIFYSSSESDWCTTTSPLLPKSPNSCFCITAVTQVYSAVCNHLTKRTNTIRHYYSYIDTSIDQ